MLAVHDSTAHSETLCAVESCTATFMGGHLCMFSLGFHGLCTLIDACLSFSDNRSQLDSQPRESTPIITRPLGAIHGGLRDKKGAF